MNLYWLLILLSVKLAKAEVDEYRLSNNVKPIHYDVSIIIPDNLETATEFHSFVRIQLLVTKFTENINIHVRNLTIDSIKLYRNGQGYNLIKDGKTDNTVEQFKMTTEPLNENEIVILECYSTGIFHSDMYGLYKSSYKRHDGTIGWIATTQFQSVYARRAFPCFDEPNLKSTFQIDITHSKNLHALSNTYGERLQTNENNRVKTIFGKTPVMSSYLVAFVVSDFEKYSSTDKYYNTWSRKEEVNNTEFSYEIVPKCLDYMERFTSLKYTDLGINKLDLIAIPDFAAGAMENWGLVTYRETSMLWDKNNSSHARKQGVGKTVVHEIAHTWFGNAITMDWWSNSWLNEGFARYFEYFALHEIEPSWELDKQFVIRVMHVIYIEDGLENALPLSNEASTPEQIYNKFGSITYNKGSSVIRMMSEFLGKDNFQKGIQDYLKHYMGSNTLPMNLLQHLQKYAKVNVSSIMDGWINQAGYPLLTVSLKGENISISQQRFFSNSSATSDITWYVPISYTTSIEKDFENKSAKTWLMNKNTTIEKVFNKNCSWMIVNIQATGYYRVNYDNTLWNGIIEALRKDNFDGIHVLNRVQIINDAMNLAKANIITYKRAFDIRDYLVKETDYYPWASAFKEFTSMRQKLNDNLEMKRKFDNMVLHLMKKLYDTVSFNPTEGSINILKQVLTLENACKLEKQDCIDKAVNLFKTFKEKNARIDPNLRRIVYCNALKASRDNKDWEFLWQKYNETNSADEKLEVIKSLGCTKDRTLLRKYLNKSVEASSGIRNQDAIYVFLTVIDETEEGFEEGLQFLQDNFELIKKYYGSMNSLRTILTNLGQAINTQKQLTSFRKFVDGNVEKLGDSIKIARSALEMADQNLQSSDNFQKQLKRDNLFRSAGSITVSFSKIVIVLIAFYGQMIISL